MHLIAGGLLCRHFQTPVSQCLPEQKSFRKQVARNAEIHTLCSPRISSHVLQVSMLIIKNGKISSIFERSIHFVIRYNKELSITQPYLLLQNQP